MSDCEDDYMCEEEEDYGLEYSEDSNSEPDVDLENQYYNSKALKEDDPKAAVASFQKVLDLEGGEKGEWGFKALKQMIKIDFKLNNYEEMMSRYKQLLTYVKSAVTRNQTERSINSILDYISTSQNMLLLQDFYETTLDALKDERNDSLWFKINAKVGRFYTMPDCEDVFTCEEEDYGQECSENSYNSEPDVDLENQYYNSKALKKDDPKAAVASFQKVLDLEGGEKREWTVKALKQIIKINFQLNNYEEMMSRYKQLLTYVKSAVTRNQTERSINSILDYISTSQNMLLLQDFYETTLDALKDERNDRLWFKTNTKLGKLYFDREDFTKLSKILKQLHQSCQTDNGEDDLKKGSQLLEIYALEIQMYSSQKNDKKLKALYEQSLLIESAIPHPLIIGIIRECGGKMHLREQEFGKAHTDFFEAFKNYDESGNPRRATSLKYLVLANMLMKSGKNPLDFEQAKPFENDPEILTMTNLVSAYQNDDINEFEKILQKQRDIIMDDPFTREQIEGLLRNIRTKVLMKLIKPSSTRIHILFISKELNIDASEVEDLLVSCIQNNTINGKIDRVNQVLELKNGNACSSRYNAVDIWTRQLSSITSKVI